jgi:chromosome segregation protein
MYLKRLEANGFKSFAHKIAFDFHPSINGVVGPNGCGKSNVVDAIKWALGEMSTKSLRGDEMLDVIFKGAAGVAPMGYAEVSLLFDNADRRLPIEFDEVLVTRRIHRTGEAEYLLNKAPCRLKDIRELFYGTGVGRDCYSVIEQGRIDFLVTASPRDRRSIFEEAAGISKYKARKREAESKLDRVGQDLQILGVQIQELARDIRSLKIQAGRAERYRLIEMEVREKRTALSLHTYHDLMQARRTIQARLESLETERAGMVRLLEETRAAVAAVEAEAREQDGALAQLQTEQLAAAQQAAALEEGLKRDQVRHGDLTAERARLEADREQQAAAMRQAEERLAAARIERDRAAIEAEACRTRLNETEQMMGQAETACAEARAALDRVQAEAIEAARKGTEHRNELSTCQAESRGVALRREKADEHVARLEAEIAAVRQDTAALAGQIERCDHDLDAVKTEVAQVGSQDAALRAELTDLAADRERLREARNRAYSREELLRGFEAQLEGLGTGAKALLRSPDHDGSPYPGICGTVADLLRVEPACVNAIENLLGDRAGWLVADNAAHALDAVEHVRAKGLHWVGVIPRNVQAGEPPRLPPDILALFTPATAPATERAPDAALERAIIPTSEPAPDQTADSSPAQIAAPAPDPAAESIPAQAAEPVPAPRAEPIPALPPELPLARNPEPAIDQPVEPTPAPVPGPAPAPDSEPIPEIPAEPSWGLRPAETCVQTDPENAAVARWCLRGYWVVADRDAAIAFLRVAPPGTGVVTLDGLIFGPEGTVGGGAREGAVSILSRRAELAGLARELASIGAEIEKAEARTTEIEAALQKTETSLHDHRVRGYEISVESSELRARNEETRKREDLLAREIDMLHRERTAIDAQGAFLDEKERRLRQVLDEVEGLERTLEAEARGRTEALARYETDREAVRRQAGDLRVVVGNAEAACRSAIEAVARLQEAHGEARVAAERAAAQLADVDRRLAECAVAVEAQQRALAEARSGLERLEVRIREVAANRDRLQARLQAEREKEATAAAQDRALEKAIGELRFQEQEQSMRLEHLLQAAREECRVELAEAYAGYRPPETFDAAAIQESIGELRRKMEAMGNVNLAAIDDLKEREERHSYLAGQERDLLAARDKLSDLITKINRESRQMFAETLEKVRTNFKDIFRRLFGGGNADIVLEEGVDILDAGIDIVAKPPQKDFTSLHLLSGGEKTLTTLALVMSIFKTNPSPFCLLDEADAALDEKNVDRYIGLVREFAKQTQFLLITHNKRSMTVADVLYGVTMQTPGVSKRVTVNLEQIQSEGGEVRILETAPAPVAAEAPALVASAAGGGPEGSGGGR